MPGAAPGGAVPAPARRASAPAGFSSVDLGGDDDDEDMSTNRNTFTCKHCKKEFTLKGNLKRHILTHAGVKPYICAICNKGFSRKADLEIHNRVHTGEKPYECPSPSCGKRFARISDLRSHERTHRSVTQAEKERSGASGVIITLTVPCLLLVLLTVVSRPSSAPSAAATASSPGATT